MAVEYKIRADASQARKEFLGMTKEQQRNAAQTRKNQIEFDRLSAAENRNTLAARRNKIAAQKLTAQEFKLAAGTKTATAGMRNQRRVTVGLAASIGALRNQVLLTTFALAGVVRGALALSKQNQALEESINAVNVVFGRAAISIVRFGLTTSQELGIARSEFNQLASVLGALLKQTEIPLQQVAKLTIELTKRATDLASVFDTDVKDALNAINSALRGQTEPITRYAADVTIAALQNFALSEGITQSVAAMTQQEKRLLRVRLILKQTEAVQDDFKNTQEGTANKSRKATSAFKDMAATLGKQIDPAINATTGFFNRLFVAITQAAGPWGFGFAREQARLLREELESLEEDDSLLGLLNQTIALNKEIKRFQDKIKRFAELAQKEFLENQKRITIEQGMLVANEKRIAFFANLKKDNSKVEFKTMKTLSETQLTLTLQRAGLTREEHDLQMDLFRLQGDKNLLEEASNAIITKRLELVKEVTSGEIDAHVAALDLEDANAASAKELERAAAAASRMAASLATSVIFGDDLKSILKSLFREGVKAAFSQAFGVPGYAHGTNFAPGGAAIVGERGPELVNLPRGSQVIPNQTTNNTNNNVSFNMPNVKTFDRFTVENQLMPLIREQLAEGDFF